MSSAHNRKPSSSQAAGTSAGADFNVNAGRDAFRNTGLNNQMDNEEIRRQQFAMRSFTQSVEMDLPPAPELPPALDIDQYSFGQDSPSRLTSSSTADTIVEVQKPDPTLGETQKYPMTVPAPGHTDQEIELHKSLMRQDSDESELPSVQERNPENAPKVVSRPRNIDKDHDALRREYSASAKQRPRPTTPTSMCTLESYAAELEKSVTSPVEKIKVKIPKKSLKGKQPEDFYQSMQNQMPVQMRESLRKSIENLGPDGDILENIPEYKDKAPKAPVVHRRTSVEWENFEDNSEPPLPSKMSEEPSPKPPTPPTSPVQSPTLEELYGDEPETNINNSIGAAREEIQKLQHKAQTAEAFAEELFGGKSDEWEAPPKNEPPESVWTASDEPPSFGDPIEPEMEIEEHEEKVEKVETPKTEPKAPTIELTEAPKNEPIEVPEGEATTGQEASALESQYYGGYDQTYYSGTEGQTEGTEQPSYDPSTYTYDQSAASYGYDENGQPYDYSQYGYDQSGNYTYDANAYGYNSTDPNAATDYSSYYGAATGTEGTTEGGDYSNTYNYDYSGTGYDYSQTGGYDYSTTAGYGTEGATTTETTGYDYGTTAEYGAEETTTTETTGYDYSTGYGAESTTAAGYDSSYYDTSQYGQDYTYGDTTDYSQYGSAPVTAPEVTATDYSEPTEGPTESTASTSSFMQPVLPPMRARTPDPFSWENQEINVETVGSVLPPPRPPPMAPSPEPFVEAEKKTEEPVVKEEEEETKAPPPRPAPPPARPPAPSPSRPPPPAAKATIEKAPTEEEEDPWAKFKKMTENVTSAVRSTEEKIKELAGQSAAEDIKDESYLSTVGGGQMAISPAVQRQIQLLEEEKKKAKADKKKAKHLNKTPSKEYTQKEEEDMDKAAEQLAAQLAARYQMESWTSSGQPPPPPPPPPAPKVPKQESIKEEKKVEENGVKEEPTEYKEIGETEEKPEFTKNWAGFGESTEFNATLPASESDFFSTHLKAVPPAIADDPFAPPKPIDPFAPVNNEDTFDPFDVRPAEDIVAKAKEKASLIATKLEDDPDYLQRPSSAYSSPTPEGGSPVSARPIGFDDEFRPGTVDSPTPLYDEDDSQPLTEFPPKFTGEGWELMIRYPPKKKIMADRYWKPCFVKINGNMLYIFDSKSESRPMQEIMLQPTYSLSDATLQAYDVYGKIHTVKLQCVQYKERIGIRAGQISRLVEGHITKYGMPIEHAAQVTVLAKFGCLNADVLTSFINVIEDFLFVTPIKREVAPLYKQDEVQIHCYDEYQAHVDKDGFVSNQQARVRMFCLAFVSGSPFLEIGLNDRRRQGKEIVRRKDILPMYTERWIRFENLDFHNTVEKKVFEEEQVIKLSPPDGVFFEICRFRVRPPKNREKPLTVKSVMRIAGSKIEIRIDVMAAAQQQRARGTTESTRTIPCEDICIRFPIPEAWIYIFREERHWGVGSVHSKSRKPGKVKNLKDRLMGAVQHQEQSLIEVGTGEAKYEHVYRALVWRISRLPEKTASAYKQYMLKCRFDLSSFDLMPEAFLPNCDVEFTMPLATISNTVVRSVSVEQHEDSDRVEKFVRYVAKCKYDVEVDYVQCNDLDNDAIFDMKVTNPEAVMNVQPEQHKPLFDPEEVAKQHTGYGIEFSESETGGAPRPRNDSSSDEEEVKRPVPIIEIDMKGYGY